MQKTEFHPPRIDFTGDALLFDLDGTLVDIAATPDAVLVPENLRPTLSRLVEQMRGAVALITGRTIESLDRTMAPLKLPAVGCHGAQFRLDPNGSVSSRAAELSDSVRDLFRDVPAQEPGVILEDKGYTMVFHYRAAPERARSLLRLVRERMQDVPPEIELMHGKCERHAKLYAALLRNDIASWGDRFLATPAGRSYPEKRPSRVRRTASRDLA
jgi:trehalose 6-phosphate phosphatase